MSGAAPLTEYERLRAANLAKNAAKLAALGVVDTARDMGAAAAALKRKAAQEKGLKSGGDPEKKRSKTEPIVIRRSLRTQGISPQGEHALGIESENRDGSLSLAGNVKIKPRELTGSHSEPYWDRERLKGPLPMRSINASEEAESALLNMLRCLKGETGEELAAAEREQGEEVSAPVDCELSKLRLAEGDVAKVVKGRIYSLTFLPSRERLLVAAGDKDGQVGLWDVDVRDEISGRNDGVFTFQTHTRPVTGLAVAPGDCTKLYSCSYDGSVRAMDVERGLFDELHSDTENMFSAMTIHDCPTLAIYLGDDGGGLSLFDPRERKVAAHSSIHDKKVNSLDINAHRDWLMVSASTDTTVSLWDLRKMGKGGAGRGKGLQPLARWEGTRGVTSAYFSPDGQALASTSYDNYVTTWTSLPVLSGDGDKEGKMQLPKPNRIPHYNNTGRWVSTFKAVWSWDSKSLLVGSMGKAVDVLSLDSLKLRHVLSSEYLSTVPARLSLHPMLPAVAGGNASGRVVVFR